jgi:hypothetical protein
MVVEPSPAPDPVVAVPPQPEPAPAAPEIAPVPADESAEGKKE